MRLVSDRAVLSRAHPAARERLARWVGLRLRAQPCRCASCQVGLIEELARALPRMPNPR